MNLRSIFHVMMIWKTGVNPVYRQSNFPNLWRLQFVLAGLSASASAFAFAFLYGEVETLWGSLSDELTVLRLAIRQMNALPLSAGSNTTQSVSVPGDHLLDFWNCNSRHEGAFICNQPFTPPVF